MIASADTQPRYLNPHRAETEIRVNADVSVALYDVAGAVGRARWAIVVEANDGTHVTTIAQGNGCAAQVAPQLVDHAVTTARQLCEPHLALADPGAAG